MEAIKSSLNGLTPSPSPEERGFDHDIAQLEPDNKVSPIGGDLEGADAFAAIFDMDGTLIDNTPYHFKSWQALFKKYGKGEVTKQRYYTEISGVPVLDTIRREFGEGRTEQQLHELLEEKESLYRDLYQPFLKPVEGLVEFLTKLKDSGIKMAMATSATIEDVDFILDNIPIREDFIEIVNSSMVAKPKPNPDIFLKAAEMLNMPPAKCVVFEDSLAGIRAANAAGMKVVGITTGHPAEALQPVGLVIDDYTNLTAQKLAALFKEQ